MSKLFDQILKEARGEEDFDLDDEDAEDLELDDEDEELEHDEPSDISLEDVKAFLKDASVEDLEECQDEIEDLLADKASEDDDDDLEDDDEDIDLDLEERKGAFKKMMDKYGLSS